MILMFLLVTRHVLYIVLDREVTRFHQCLCTRTVHIIYIYIYIYIYILMSNKVYVFNYLHYKYL